MIKQILKVNQKLQKKTGRSENLEEFKNKFASLTATVNKEKKEETKKQKKTERTKFMDNLKAGTKVVHYECNKCDVITESLAKLKNHERTSHLTSCSSQTEDKVFEDKLVQCNNLETLCDKTMEKNIEVCKEVRLDNYCCFYCDLKIESETHLIEHRRKCRGSTRMFCAAPLGLPNGFFLGHPPLRYISPFGFVGTRF